MKLLLTFVIASASVLAQPPAQHFQTALVDCRVAFSITTPVALPGAGDPTYEVGMSLTVSDDQAMLLGVYLKLKLADGSYSVFKSVVTKNSAYGVPTYVDFVLPPGVVPVSIERLDITRLHSEPNDVMTCTQCRN